MKSAHRRCLIVNPNAGSVDDVEGLRLAIAALEPITVRETAAEGDAARIAREAREAGFDCLIAAGGDGTLSEVINGLAPDCAGITVGVLPLGTGNDFARAAGVPDDLEAAIAVIAADQATAVDLISASDGRHSRWAINACTGGFSSVVDAALDASLKERFGPWAYLLAAGKALADLEPYRFTLELDGAVEQSVVGYNFVVANGRWIGGGRLVAPAADPADGLLDVLLVPALPLPELTAAVTAILRGQGDAAGLLRSRVRSVRVASDPAVRCTVDGELALDTPATFSVLPAALRFLHGDAPPAIAG